MKLDNSLEISHRTLAISGHKVQTFIHLRPTHILLTTLFSISKAYHGKKIFEGDLSAAAGLM